MGSRARTRIHRGWTVNYLLLIVRITFQLLEAKLNNKPVDAIAAGYRLISAGRAFVEQESGQPIDEAKIPPISRIE